LRVQRMIAGSFSIKSNSAKFALLPKKVHSTIDSIKLMKKSSFVIQTFVCSPCFYLENLDIASRDAEPEPHGAVSF
jgi:hypothetical protein